VSVADNKRIVDWRGLEDNDDRRRQLRRPPVTA
jgi:hypothetical protein